MLALQRHVHIAPASASLHRLVLALVLTLNRSRDSSSLMASVHQQMAVHRNRLQSYLQIPATGDDHAAIWTALSAGSLGLVLHDKDIISRRATLFSTKLPRPSASYNQFARQLYPLSRAASLPLNVDHSRKTIDYPHNLRKYAAVNHARLYKAYLELPSPFAQMTASDFEAFLDKFLHHKSNFVRPNIISESGIAGRPARIVSNAFEAMVSKRADYVKMVSRILNDMRANEIPLTLREQNQLIFLSFYKDKPEILTAIDEAMVPLSIDEVLSFHDAKLSAYAVFDWDVYLLIKLSFKFLPVDTYNILLFHAIRHDRPEIVADILKDLNLAHLSDPTLERTTPVFNSTTLRYLIDYFSAQKSPTALARSIDEVVNCNFPVDITLVNSIIKGLCNCNSPELAESLVNQLFIDGKASSTPEDEESVLYKLLTPEDRHVYNAMVRILENIGPITGESIPQYSLIPTEGSFRPIIRAICSPDSGQTYHKLLTLIDHMEHAHKLPITTRTVRSIMDKFTNDTSNQWTLQNLIEITSKIISVHDYTYNITRDTLVFSREDRPHLFERELSPKLQNFVKLHWKETKPLKLPIDRGTFLKLSDDVTNKIYQAFFATLNRQIRMEHQPNEIERLNKLVQSVQIQKASLQQELENTRNGKSGPHNLESARQDIYNNDELNYIKKGYLIDLIDIVSHD
ncbi:uncharacterized protein CANTADRAFT_27640 [Suhomyces tanzawaensis NRRL Y-17324]|uniref:Mitochondrial group I intron splicing factor CCM1 n=1 Tax=Suhomyces tanzawaensis NRRL Y-17324 TaxID=984487 RepID=A0A1E4SBY3_9ASCO|nr:uncharacterized protein CANTADRAFT_27640 [Suhomyces tanzawaensis NRRL Y-17324]ODV76902.1 hypothetical protein CANTADRAFT_27640 [Suhomyces tanzawaensis NRRL Y-17324]